MHRQRLQLAVNPQSKAEPQNADHHPNQEQGVPRHSKSNHLLAQIGNDQVRFTRKDPSGKG